MAGRQKGRPHKHNATEAELLECRRAFEAGESIRSIVARTGVAQQTIRNHISAEGWIPSRLLTEGIGANASAVAKAAVQEARSNVINIATRMAQETAERSGVMEHIANDLPRHVLSQAQLAEAAMMASKAMFAQFIYEMAQPLEDGNGNVLRDKNGKTMKLPVTKERADTLASLVSSARASVAMSRDIEGRKSGQPSVFIENLKEDNTLEIISRRIETVRVAVDDGGRAIIDGTAI